MLYHLSAQRALGSIPVVRGPSLLVWSLCPFAPLHHCRASLEEV